MCRKVGNNRPKSRGRDRRPPGRAARSGYRPCAGPRRASPGCGKMARQHPAVERGASQLERTTGKRGISPAASRHHELPEAAIQGPRGRLYS